MIKVAVLVGVRPQIIKAAPLIRCLNDDSEILLQLIHSGQHYDYEMSKVFFNELDLPEPWCNLNVGSGSHAYQTGKLILRVEKVFGELKPDVVVVFGDANTTLGGALAAVKMHFPVCHVEAGLRSFDMSMPEEVNRVLVDHCSRMLCAPTATAVRNLKSEGVFEEFIFLSGDTMYDAFLEHRSDVEESTIVNDLSLGNEVYAVLTLHRPENVDDFNRLGRIVSAVAGLDVKVVFPVHPRTSGRLRQAGLWSVLKEAVNVLLLKPVTYFDMLSLMRYSAVVLTDSGGVQKEAFFLRVPCVTLRYNTEWIETVGLGANRLVGAETELIVKVVKEILEKEDLRKQLQGLSSPFGDGKASGKIANEIKERHLSGELEIKPASKFN